METGSDIGDDEVGAIGYPGVCFEFRHMLGSATRNLGGLWREITYSFTMATPSYPCRRWRLLG